MLNCLIVDDEQHAIELLEMHLKKVPYVNIKATFTDALKAIEYLHTHEADLIFLDVNMPDISGIEFIKVLNKKINIIIVSAFREYALEGFEHEVVDFILKPVSFDRLLRSLQKARPVQPAKEKEAAENAEYIVLKTDSKNKLYKVDFDDIVYVEGLKNYVSVITSTQKIVTLLNIKSLEDQLPKERFIRVHKSYIVSLNQVKSVDGNQIFLKDIKEAIPVSETYKAAFFNLLKNQLVQNKKP